MDKEEAVELEVYSLLNPDFGLEDGRFYEQVSPVKGEEYPL
ncbi:hypothetical protein [Radiobacillus kanasensis]|nr:hypothetical protein [Radiobacillus kanasensis]